MAYLVERYTDVDFDGLRRIGEAIREARRRSGYSQRDLGMRIGLSQSSISRIECGLTPTVRFMRLARLLVVFDPDITISQRRPPGTT